MCGANRSNNEDYQYVSPDRSIFIVADGMGGHRSGEFASRFVVDALTHQLDQTLQANETVEAVEEHVREAFKHANCLLLDAAQKNPEYGGAGSTALVALVFGDRLFVSGIGDSRAYFLRSNKLEQLTLDDSIPGYLQKAGVISAEEAKIHPMRNRLCSFMGMDNFQPDEDIQVISLRPEDVVLLCSDGLTDVVEDDIIRAVLQSHRNPQLAARQLVQMAVENLAKDDITCVVFRVDKETPVQAGESSSWFREFAEKLKGFFGQRPTPAI